MAEAVIVDAVRTPGGKRGGSLKDWHPVDLLSEVLRALVERNDLDPALVDDEYVAAVPPALGFQLLRQVVRRAQAVNTGANHEIFDV